VAYAHGVNLGPLIRFKTDNTTVRQLYSAATPAALAWSAEQTTAQPFVPQGVRWIRVRARLHIVATAVNTLTQLLVFFSDNNANTPSNFTAHPMVEAIVGAYAIASYGGQVKEIDIPLSATRTFYLYTEAKSNVGGEALFVACLGYYMGG
jgi:hypothetical protein